MTPKEFVTKYRPFALKTQEKTGISADFILAQAALESGWGKKAPGNMFFGIKDVDGLNGNEQLLTTTEFLKTDKAKFPVVLSIEKVLRNGVQWFKYKVKDYFRKYSSPEESFTDHAMFFLRNRRYSKALQFRHNPYRFAEEIAKAGYATDPSYAAKLSQVIAMVEKSI